MTQRKQIARRAGWAKAGAGSFAALATMGLAMAAPGPASASPKTTSLSESTLSRLEAASYPTNTTKACKGRGVQLEAWIWVPGIYRMVDVFNETHPGICVKLDDVGAGDTEYVKLTDAIKANSGVPDVAEVEFDELPSYEITHSVVNLVPYGADKYKSDFAPFAWKEVSQGSAVYAMPGDSGPMDLFCNSKELAQYHVTPGTTWAAFAKAAAAFHKADPKGYLTVFDPEDMQYLVSLMGQLNAFPFRWSGGAKVTVNFTGANAMKFANYWQGLISAGYVKAAADFQNAFWSDLNNGTYACWVTSAWGPSYLAPNLTSASLGDWRTYPLPQWTPGADVAANWGGSTYPVFTASKHPAQAAEFSEWMNGTMQSWKIMYTPPSSLFPTFLPLLDQKFFVTSTIPATGKTPIFNQAAAAAPHVAAVSWPPFMTYFLALTTTANIIDGKGTLPGDFKQLQSIMTSYAKSQGFTVSS
jgi:multiple sugar transport system substrate-binding protein